LTCGQSAALWVNLQTDNHYFQVITKSISCIWSKKCLALWLRIKERCLGRTRDSLVWNFIISQDLRLLRRGILERWQKEPWVSWSCYWKWIRWKGRLQVRRWCIRILISKGRRIPIFSSQLTLIRISRELNPRSSQSMKRNLQLKG